MYPTSVILQNCPHPPEGHLNVENDLLFHYC